MRDQNKAKSQHTVPRFYLAGFLDPNSPAKRLEVYSKRSGRWHRLAPKSATVVDHFYSFKRPDGTYDTGIETWLNEAVENPAVLPFQRLISGDSVSADQRIALATFIGHLLVRTTKIRELQNSLDQLMSDPVVTEDYVERNREKLLRRFSQSEIDGFVRNVNQRGFGISLPEHWSLQVLALGEKYGRLIASMNWRVEVTTLKYSFVTSDNPAFVCIPKTRNLQFYVGLTRDDLGSELCFPLCKTAYLRASYNSLGSVRGRVPQTRVAELNRRVAVHATNFVICPARTESLQTIVERERAMKVVPLDAAAAVRRATIRD